MLIYFIWSGSLDAFHALFFGRYAVRHAVYEVNAKACVGYALLDNMGVVTDIGAINNLIILPGKLHGQHTDATVEALSLIGVTANKGDPLSVALPAIYAITKDEHYNIWRF